MEEKISGLLLHAVPYLGRKKILKIFTPDGLLSLISNSSKFPTDPFCLAEWVYRKNQRELYPLVDATLFDSFHNLRQSLSTLTAAGSIAQDLLKTQMPHKASAELFQLASLYFKNLEMNPPILAASFRLKLLYHEGLLGEEEKIFTAEEWEQVSVLAFGRKLSIIAGVTAIPPEKIGALFLDRFSL